MSEIMGVWASKFMSFILVEYAGLFVDQHVFGSLPQMGIWVGINIGLLLHHLLLVVSKWKDIEYCLSVVIGLT